VTRAVALVLVALEGLDRDKESMIPVSTLDLQRHAGTWYEIARLPNARPGCPSRSTRRSSGGPRASSTSPG
jgi:lipocalin